MANSKKNNEQLSEKVNIVIGITVGIITLVVIVVMGFFVFSNLTNGITGTNNENNVVNDQGNTEDVTNGQNGENNVTDGTGEEKPVTDTTLANEKQTHLVMQTSKGDVSMTLYPDLMPITVTNFIELVNQNFYDNLKFHRVEGWVVQTGDPTGTGSSGSKNINFETTPKLSHVRGAIGMARRNDDYNSASSQFYIVKQDTTSIDGEYALFGTVTSGMDIIDSLVIGDTVQDIRIVE